MKSLLRLICDEAGATAIEYGLIVALIALAMVAALDNVAASKTEMFNNIVELLEESS